MVNQNLYRGGQTTAETKQREYEIQAQRAELSGSEQQVFLDAQTAYINVVRDQAVVELQENNEKILSRQLEATRDRLQLEKSPERMFRKLRRALPAQRPIGSRQKAISKTREQILNASSV